MSKKLIIFFMLISINIDCICQENTTIKLINKEAFEKIVDGKQVRLFTLKNRLGTVSQITNYGGKVVSLWIQDKNGNYDDVVLGYSNIDGFLTAKEKYFGALIGRYGNRIG